MGSSPGLTRAVPSAYPPLGGKSVGSAARTRWCAASTHHHMTWALETQSLPARHAPWLTCWFFPFPKRGTPAALVGAEALRARAWHEHRFGHVKNVNFARRCAAQRAAVAACPASLRSAGPLDTLALDFCPLSRVWWGTRRPCPGGLSLSPTLLGFLWSSILLATSTQGPPQRGPGR